MTTFLLAFALLGIVIMGMAIGVLMGRKPIAGSCGGVGKALGEKDYTCDICGGDPKKCDEQSDNSAMFKTDLAVDATNNKHDK